MCHAVQKPFHYYVDIREPNTYVINETATITLCNKNSGVCAIPTNSTSLGLTDTQINTRFAPLAQIFLQNGFF